MKDAGRDLEMECVKVQLARLDERMNHIASKEDVSQLRASVDAKIAEVHLRFQSLETKVARWLLAHLVVEVTFLIAVVGLVWDMFPQ
jgi:hypothetical protein